ncbi:unnamed protein product [Durusdinium trenchii]|uniref:Uncharacterized protein n=1 Tax=Durusdinium trenchii TaxID=1381693 RepID=A0ABP0QXJ6_9DINO
MDCLWLSLEWERQADLRNRLRTSKMLLEKQVGEQFCVPSRPNAVANAMVLRPVLDRLNKAEKFRLPHLDDLKVEIRTLYEKCGLTPGDKDVYQASMELKRLAGLVKRRAHRKEVTKEMGHTKTVFGRKSELLEQIAQKKAELQRKNAIVRSNSSLTLFLVQGKDPAETVPSPVDPQETMKPPAAIPRKGARPVIPASDTEDTQLVEEHAFSMAMPLEDEGDEREPDPPTKLSEESKSPAEPTPAEVLTRRDQLKLKEAKKKEQEAKQAEKKAEKEKQQAEKKAAAEAKKAAKKAEQDAKKLEKAAKAKPKGKAKAAKGLADDAPEKPAEMPEEPAKVAGAADGPGGNDGQPPQKRRRLKQSEVAEPELKAQVEAKAKAEPKPKGKSKAKAKGAPRAKGKEPHEDDDEVATPKRKLFQSDGEGEEKVKPDDEESIEAKKAALLQQMFEDDKPSRWRKSHPQKPSRAAAKSGASAEVTHGKGKKKPELSPFAKKEVRRRKKAELQTMQSSPQEDAQVQGILMQHAKVCQDMPFDALKKYLYGKVQKKFTKSYLNPYLQKQACGVKVKLEGWKAFSEIFYFGRCGTAPSFNAGCVAAYAAWLDEQPNEEIEKYEDPNSLVQAKFMSFKYNANLAMSQDHSTFALVETFAGQAEVTRNARMANYRTALAMMLRGDWIQGWVAFFGLKCSTWTSVNAGTSGRSACSSIGNCEYKSVRDGNCLGSRMILLMMVAVCLNATIILEQPFSSYFQFYPRFRELVCMLQKHGGPTAVHKTCWYMLHYGSPTPKRHYAFSNSRHVARLDAGKLRGWEKRKGVLKTMGKSHDLVDKYVDSNGKARWKGNSRNYPAKFGQKMATLMNDLISEKKGIPELPESTPSAESTFSSMTFEDLWSEAYLTSVCHYLRGGNYLKIPPSFRELVPKKL